MWLMSGKQVKGERQGEADSSVAASCAGFMLTEHRHCLACSPASDTQDERKKYLQSEYVAWELIPGTCLSASAAEYPRKMGLPS